MDLLTDYISFARNCVMPELSDDAAEALVEGYVEMRKLGGAKKVRSLPQKQWGSQHTRRVRC